ncbi:MAG: hypothetical protein ACRCYU_11655 [Nocardioides sp.]
MRAPRPGIRRLGAGAGLLALSLTLAACGDAMETSMDSAATRADGSGHGGMEDMASGGHGGQHGAGHSHAQKADGDGRSATRQGISLADVETNATSDRAGLITFHVELANGATATSFQSNLGKAMHLYLVTNDLATYLHLHPVRDALGNWSAEVPPLPGGQVHVVTSFVVNDIDSRARALTLGTDLMIPGTAPRAAELPAPAPTAEVDGYTLTLGDDLTVGIESKLNVTVTKDGEPVALEPYLGSWSHVSVFSSSNLSHVHLHPAQEWQPDTLAPETLTFVWTPPAAGTYRFFVEFMAAGELRRAEFTRSVTSGS